MTDRVVTAELYDETNTTPIETGGLNVLVDALEVTWQEHLSELGAGTVKLDLADPARAEMTPGRVVRFCLDGVAKFAAMIGRPNTVMVSNQEDAGEDSTYECLGLLVKLVDGAVSPELGTGVVSPSTRRMGFWSRYFDVSPWPAAAEIKLQSYHVVGVQWLTDDGHSAPNPWFNSLAYWIWCRAQLETDIPERAAAAAAANVARARWNDLAAAHAAAVAADTAPAWTAAAGAATAYATAANDADTAYTAAAGQASSVGDTAYASAASTVAALWSTAATDASAYGTAATDAGAAVGTGGYAAAEAAAVSAYTTVYNDEVTASNDTASADAEGYTGQSPQPVGRFPGVIDFTLTEDVTLGIDFAADDGYELGLDGEAIAQDLTARAWGSSRRWKGFKSAGDHRLAFAAENMLRVLSATNVAGILITGYKMIDGGETPGPVVFQTDAASVKVLDYPDPWPTMTPGQVIRILVEEAQARGALVGVTLNFTDELDSDGSSWNAGVDLTINVGDPILNVVKQLVETSIDVRMSATGLVLSAWNKDSMGGDSGVVLAKGDNLTAASTQGEPTLGTAALYQDARGIWHWRESPNIGTSGRKEFGVQLGSASGPQQGELSIDAIFADVDTPTDHATYAYEEEASTLLYDDLDLGDAFTTIDEAGDATPARLEGFTCTHDDAGYLVISGLATRL